VGLTQKEVADEWGVDARELRDYIRYKHNHNPEITATAQAVMDDAYHHYCADNANMPWVSYLRSSAKQFGINPRGVQEVWETEPSFYPTNYSCEK